MLENVQSKTMFKQKQMADEQENCCAYMEKFIIFEVIDLVRGILKCLRSVSESSTTQHFIITSNNNRSKKMFDAS